MSPDSNKWWWWWWWWESVKHVQLYCERLDMVRIVQLLRLTFLNGLCVRLNEVICQCYSWYRKGKNFTKLCNEYNTVGCNPLIVDVFAKFRAVCESWLSLISCTILDIDLSICLSVCISSFYVFICLPEWWINVYIKTAHSQREYNSDCCPPMLVICHSLSYAVCTESGFWSRRFANAVCLIAQCR